MFDTGPVQSKDPSGEKVGIKWAFQQVAQRQEAQEKLEKMQLEMAQLQEQANAPLKRKPDASDAEPPAKKPRIDGKSLEVSQPEVAKDKAKPKPKPKPKPKLKQPKLSAFFKKI